MWVIFISAHVGKEPGVFDLVIINDDLDEAYEKLKSVLIEVILKKCKEEVPVLDCWRPGVYRLST